MVGSCGVRCIVWVALTLGSAAAGAQGYSEIERVTATDLPLEFSRDRGARDLSKEELVVLVGGEAQPIVALESLKASDLQPYQVLVYLDSEMVDRHHLQASSDLLLEARTSLIELGTVDVVVADPQPRFVLRGSGEETRVEEALRGGPWRSTSGDGIRALRSAFLEAISNPESAGETEALAAAYIGEETRLVQQRLDLLASFLAENGVPGKLKILLLVGLRFDMNPAEFYQAWIKDDGSSAVQPRVEMGGVESQILELAEAAAAYGFITLPVAPAEPSGPLVPGVRIGKWRLSGPAGGRILGIKLSRESERDPELAEGYLENGEALLGEGRSLEAKAAFEKALHHFYGDPKTAELQARALMGLSTAEEMLGDDDRARTLKFMASNVDAAVAKDLDQPLSILLDPRSALEVLAQESSGVLVEDVDGMHSTVSDLDRRVRLSIQLVGEPTGVALPVAVQSTMPGVMVSQPRWVRFGTPDHVAAARVRLVMSGELLETAQDLDARLTRDEAGDGSARLELRLEGVGEVAATEVDEERRCRLTIGTGSAEEGSQHIEHRRVPCHSSQDGLSASDVVSGELEFAVVLLEHLASAEWGVNVVEREDPL